ncbi:MAG: hypothetical protein GY828_02535 [Candidatus Gracilibacteria bacterium]|nr:hypothetical protein [Candidatus Gracilibacteria bacterium]
MDEINIPITLTGILGLLVLLRVVIPLLITKKGIDQILNNTKLSNHEVIRKVNDHNKNTGIIATNSNIPPGDEYDSIEYLRLGVYLWKKKQEDPSGAWVFSRFIFVDFYFTHT